MLPAKLSSTLVVASENDRIQSTNTKSIYESNGLLCFDNWLPAKLSSTSVVPSYNDRTPSTNQIVCCVSTSTEH